MNLRVATAHPTSRLALAFAAGAGVGALGGLIGLGGAEFRLPLLIGLFGFAALAAVILNKAMSLVVVAAALMFRTRSVPVDQLVEHWSIVVNLLGGSLVGAWCGASWATRAHPKTLYRAIAMLLILIAAALLTNHVLPANNGSLLRGPAQVIAGLLAGLGIGAVASLMGVAGGELLIPTLVLLFAVDIKLAGSLSLAVSLPTMIVGFARYSLDGSFAVLQQNKQFVLAMASGSVAGAAVGAAMVGVAPAAILLPLLALILLVSAWKVRGHR